jgi:2-polyprenyl-3-methyl-5-hydroxy-6-metoxy-1,4-benzoquinol methylase
MFTIPSDKIPETGSCPLCGQDGAHRLFFSKDRIHKLPGTFGLFRCMACHAIFIQPWLGVEQLAGYYPEEYGRYRHSRSLDKKNYSGWHRFVRENYYGYPRSKQQRSTILRKTAAFALSFVMAKGVIPYHGEGKILDVGCGGGSYLYRLRQWGWECYGVEPSENGVKQARSLGLEVRHGMLADVQFPDAFFDVVRLSHVLEHLPNPTETFREIDRILQPEGLVYLTVPNTRSLAFSLFKQNWYALDSPRHVISYCPKTLETLCKQTGFEMAEISFNTGPFILVRSIRYFLEEEGEKWPGWIRKINWEKGKSIRRALKPFFLVVDSFGFGDFLHAVLRKTATGRFTFATVHESAAHGFGVPSS